MHREPLSHHVERTSWSVEGWQIDRRHHSSTGLELPSVSPFLLALILVFSWSKVHAHTQDTSYLRALVSKDSLELRFTFDLATLYRIKRIDTDSDAKVSRAEAESAAGDIAGFLSRTVSIEINGRETGIGAFQTLGWPVDAGPAVEEADYGKTLVHLTFRQQSKRVIQDVSILYELFGQLGDAHRVVADLEQEEQHLEVVFNHLEPDYVYDTFWHEGERPMRFRDGVKDIWSQWWTPWLLMLLTALTARWSLLKYAFVLAGVGAVFWIFGNRCCSEPLLRAGPWQAGMVAGMMIIAVITLPLRMLLRSVWLGGKDARPEALGSES